MASATATERVFNFSPGPAVMPLPVLEQAQRELVCLPGYGMSVLEMSHRSAGFLEILATTKRLLKELSTIRERGYGLDEEEREKGVCCIAAPIRNHTGDVVAAISAAGPVQRMPRELAGSATARAVMSAASAISIDLGYVEGGSYGAVSTAHGGRR